MRVNKKTAVFIQAEVHPCLPQCKAGEKVSAAVPAPGVALLVLVDCGGFLPAASHAPAGLGRGGFQLSRKREQLKKLQGPI